MAPYRFNDIIPWTYFENILKSLTITNKTPPANKDQFWEVSQLVDAWNHSTDEKNIYISCLGGSMMNWVNKYTYLGLIFVPHKPCSFFNEWYNIALSEDGTLFLVELDEGKDAPAEKAPQKIFQER